jgi:hypothetical protein
MRIRVGCELRFEFPQTTPMIVMLNVHFSRASELEGPDYLITNPPVPIEGYRDSFGNWCSRLVAPGGHFSLGTDAVIRDSGMADPIDLNNSCRRNLYCFCLAAVTVKPIVYPTRLGASSETRRLVGRECRLSATSYINTLHSVTSIPVQPERHLKHTQSAREYAVTTLILPSLFAAA